jgi:hypothetical protein
MHTSTYVTERGHMRAALRRLHSPDIDDLSAYHPEREDDFGFLLQVFAGPEGGDGEEAFDLILCTPKWLERKHSRSDLVFGRHHLIVFRYDYARLVREFELLCESAEGDSWRDVAMELSRFGRWEFEDYAE